MDLIFKVIFRVATKLQLLVNKEVARHIEVANSNSNNEEDNLNKKEEQKQNFINMEKLSKEELTQRLLKMASETNPPVRINRRMAMCYSIMPPTATKQFICDRCGAVYTVTDYGDHKPLRNMVKQIQELGYDAKLEIVCNKCHGSSISTKRVLRNVQTGAIKEERGWDRYINDIIDDDETTEPGYEYVDIPYSFENMSFCFRFNEKEEYHRTNDKDDYICNEHNLQLLYTFLQNNKLYSTFETDKDGGQDYYIGEHWDVIEKLTGIHIPEEKRIMLPMTNDELSKRLVTWVKNYREIPEEEKSQTVNDHKENSRILKVKCDDCGKNLDSMFTDTKLHVRDSWKELIKYGYKVNEECLCTDCLRKQYTYSWENMIEEDKDTDNGIWFVGICLLRDDYYHTIHDSGKVLECIYHFFKGDEFYIGIDGNKHYVAEMADELCEKIPLYKAKYDLEEEDKEVNKQSQEPGVITF